MGIYTTAGIVPYMRISDVIVGEKDGLSGGICNVDSGNLFLRERIEDDFYKQFFKES